VYPEAGTADIDTESPAVTHTYAEGYAVPPVLGWYRVALAQNSAETVVVGTLLVVDDVVVSVPNDA
jgi:hypothetical protein